MHRHQKRRRLHYVLGTPSQESRFTGESRWIRPLPLQGDGRHI